MSHLIIKIRSRKKFLMAYHGAAQRMSGETQLVTFVLLESELDLLEKRRARRVYKAAGGCPNATMDCKPLWLAAPKGVQRR
jgi:hypothetical protein